MDVQYLSQQDLLKELEQQRKLISELTAEKITFQAQKNLLASLVTRARASSEVENELLRETLQQTLDLASSLTCAEKGSLFLLDPAGRVTDSILTRTQVTAEMRTRLIGTVLDKGLAGWVSRHRKIGLILDTEEDDRWLTLPNQPYVVKSALAVPAIGGEDLLAILTLLHSEPHHFTQEMAEVMQATANQIALVLENARLYAELDRCSKALNLELEKGRQIQIDFLPSEIPERPNLEIAACFYPARQVAGDFYDVFELPGNYLGLVIADVCDKGVGAALFMALFRSLIRVFSGQTQLCGLSIIPVGEVAKCEFDTTTIDFEQMNALKAVSLTHNYIAQNHWQMSMFATLFFGVLDPQTGLLSFINGGHEPLFIVGDSGIKTTLNPTGPAVGMMPDMNFKVQQVNLEPGDILIGYTDGVTEGKSPSGKLFSNERLRSLLEQPAASASELLERIKSNLFAYINDAPQFDDITMLAVRFAAPK